MKPRDYTNYHRVSELLLYKPRLGVLIWRVSMRHGQVPRGSIAGHVGADGYRTIMIDGKAYKAQRLAWLLYTGSWPKDQIDHANRIKDDNRFVNLREATKSQNQINSGMYRNNKSGYRGVCFNKASNKWAAEIKRNKKMHRVGLFATALEAHEQRCRALNQEGA